MQSKPTTPLSRRKPLEGDPLSPCPIRRSESLKLRPNGGLWSRHSPNSPPPPSTSSSGGSAGGCRLMGNGGRRTRCGVYIVHLNMTRTTIYSNPYLSFPLSIIFAVDQQLQPSTDKSQQPSSSSAINNTNTPPARKVRNMVSIHSNDELYWVLGPPVTIMILV